jgi:hypothetical protein
MAMPLYVTALAQRRPVDDLGNAAIGVPNLVMSLPVRAERPAATMTPAI